MLTLLCGCERRAQAVLGDAQLEMSEGVRRQFMLKLEEHIQQADALVEKLTGLKDDQKEGDELIEPLSVGTRRLWTACDG